MQVNNMPAESRSNMFGYGVIGVGIVMSFISAVVPFYTTGHQLLFGDLLAVITPYLAYALVVVLLRRPVTDIAGAIVLLLHSWLVIRERFVNGADYTDGAIYKAPLVLTVLLFPLVVRALREPWHKQTDTGPK